MKNKLLFSFIVELFLSFPAIGQEDNHIEDALEQYVSQTGEGIEDDSKMLALNGYLQEPLNLNQASKGDLQQLFFLNSLQIHAFLEYRKLLGPLISIYELQAIPHWDLKTIQFVLPYVTVMKASNTRLKLPELFERAELHMLLRYKRTLEKKKGYRVDSLGNRHYLGSPGAVYFRMQLRMSNHMNVGITAESDAGEPFSGYGQKGFDFYSFHFYLENRGFLEALAVGDYRINLGQGLINQQGLSFGKTGMVMQIDRSQETIRPHTSAMESGFYRGAAAKFGLGKWSSTLFISKKSEDAHFWEVDSFRHYFRSIQSSGYHRSVSDFKNKGKLQLFSSGGNLKYDFGDGHIGLNLVYHHFSDSMGRSGQPYQLFHNIGYNMLNASVDYAWYLNKLYFFGETAVNETGAWATVNGLLMSVDRRVDLSLLFRSFSPQYTSLYAKAFAESSHPQNETGYYIGVAVRPASHWKINLYSDFFRSQWLRYRVDVPSYGQEQFLQVNYTPSEKVESYLRFRYKRKPINVLSDHPMAKVVNTSKYNLRLFFQWKMSEYFRIRDQIEGVYFKKGEEKAERGFMAYQSARWETNGHFSGNFRLGYFHTGGYDSRIYTYENNVRYAFYVPSFFGEGIRSYLNLRIDIGKRLSLWTRIARTWYFHQETISSGWNEIQGNKRTKFTIELIYD
ncbi:MAG TPA: helix-hairpin-helix domain-containing protein [Chitinophagaceae bacterium]|nr:helix-hairpin-helix domain-containing protein [Chitinophagaceae bacterium]